MARKKRQQKNLQTSTAALPEFENTARALDWWRGRIRQGLPVSADTGEHFKELAEQCSGQSEREVFTALKKIACQAIEQAGQLGNNIATAGFFAADQSGESLFVANATGGIGCLDSGNGKTLWRIPADRAFQVGAMAVHEKTLYYTDSWHNRLGAVDIHTGNEFWSAEAASDNSRLLCPVGLAVLDRDDKPVLLVSDSGSHRLCTFSLDGSALETHGKRGLLREQTAFAQTAPEGTSVQQCYEYPRDVSVTGSGNQNRAAWVWDSVNGRLIVLDARLNVTRTIQLMDVNETIPRLAGQVVAVNGPTGAVIIVIDDLGCTMTIHADNGTSLLSFDLTSLMHSSRRKFERLRVDCAGTGDDGLLLMSNSGGLWKIPLQSLDSKSLISKLATLFPDDCHLVMANAESFATDSSHPWQIISPTLDPNTLVRGLLDERDIITEEFSLTVGHLDTLAGSLNSGSGEDGASALGQSVILRLEKFRAETLNKLRRFAHPSPGEIERWSDAQAEVDMEIFQSRGRQSSAELKRDSDLEQIRELRPSIRSLSWKLRTLHKLLSPRQDSGWIENTAAELLDMLESMLNERLEIISSTAETLEYDREPQRVALKEIKSSHAAGLRASALDYTAVELAAELERLVREYPEALAGLDKDKLEELAARATGLECRESLVKLAGQPSAGIKAEEILPDVPALNGSVGDKMKSLVDNMAAYLETVRNSGGSGGKFGRVLERQRSLFALKASVLSNYLAPDSDSNQALESARTISGEAWRETRQMRLSVMENNR